MQPREEIENGRVCPPETDLIGRVAKPQPGAKIRRAVADVVFLDDRSMRGEVIDDERHEFAGEPIGIGVVAVAAQAVHRHDL